MTTTRRTVTAADIYYLAGLFEGEGCISRQSNTGGFRLDIQMADEDVLRTAQERAGGIGSLYLTKNRDPSRQHHKPLWRWSVVRSRDAAGLLMTMYPLLGERRQARAREALEQWRELTPPKSDRSHCKRGHPLSGENLYRYVAKNGHTHRSCKTCRALRQRGEI